MSPRSRALVVACLATALVAATGLAGCEAVLGLGGLSEQGGADAATDASAQDSTTPPMDGARDDGTVDSGAPRDTSSPMDTSSAPDSSTVDAATDSGPYWTFSDGFEVGDLRRWTTTQHSAGGTLAVVDAGAYAGCCALHATANADVTAYESAGESWTTALQSAPALQTGTVAVRAHFKAATLDVITTELQVTQGGTSGVWAAQAGLKNPSTSWFWQVFLVDPAHPTGTFTNATGTTEVLPDTTYHCVEMVLNVSPAPSVGRLSIFLDALDDQAVPLVTMSADTTTDAGWDTAFVGLPFSTGLEAGLASDVLVDDVTVSLYTDLSPTVHIGCP